MINWDNEDIHRYSSPLVPCFSELISEFLTSAILRHTSYFLRLTRFKSCIINYPKPSGYQTAVIFLLKAVSMENKTFTNIRSLLEALAKAMNLINPEVEHHHEQTAYLSYFIARQMNLDIEQIHTVIYAAFLHDVGGAMLDEPTSVIEIESEAEKYAKIGAEMLRDLPYFSDIASVIAYCQTNWQNVLAESSQNKPCARLASIVHLADAASLCLNPEKRVLNQVKDICSIIESGKGTYFMPEAVEAFLSLRPYETIWLDAMENPNFLFYFTGDIHQVTLEQTADLTKLMSRIIDYRSSFTAMHSAGVATTAFELARLSGMSEEDCLKMEIAGNLHDLGKLVVPREILEKPGKLTPEEFNVIKEHTYYTRLILMGIDGFENIADWAAYHHEKLNGKGYPFHLSAEHLDLGSRIMAVADIFSAITEVRPYRAGMQKDQVIRILKEDVESGAICGDIVNLLIENYDQIDAERDRKSREAGKRYFENINLG